MIRGTALCLVLALTAASASRLACVWECVEPDGGAGATAACHDVPASGATLTAAESHCPLTPEGAALWTVKGSEPQRLRDALDVARLSHAFDGAIIAWPFRFTGPPPLHHARGAALQTNAVLRI